MSYSYRKNTPTWLAVVASTILILALFPIGNLIYLGIRNLEFGYAGEMSLTSLGQLGDFFGGNTAAFTSALSLIAVLFFTHHQSKQQENFFTQQRDEAKLQTSRSFFLEGVSLITQWDLASPGSDQCSRLLDYYGRLALSSDDRELLLILNTVITAQIRSNLQGANGSYKRTNYPYACEAIEKIAELRKEDGLAMKKKREEQRQSSSRDLSTPQAHT